MKYHKALEAIARRPTALLGVICNRTEDLAAPRIRPCAPAAGRRIRCYEVSFATTDPMITFAFIMTGSRRSSFVNQTRMFP